MSNYCSSPTKEEVFFYFAIPEFELSLEVEEEFSVRLGNFLEEDTMNIFPFGKKHIRGFYPAHLIFTCSPENSEIVIESIGIPPPLQGRGHAKSLVGCLENLATGNNYDRISLNSENDSFWRHMGYAPNGYSSPFVKYLYPETQTTEILVAPTLIS